MAVLGGILQRACTELKSLVNEPANSTKLTNDIALRKLAGTFQDVFSEVMQQSEDELALTLDHALSAYDDDDNLPLPALCSCVKDVLAVDANGAVVGKFRQLRKHDMQAPRYGYEIRGPYLHLVKPPNWTVATTIRIVYEPLGYLPLHYGTLDATNAALVDQTDGLWVCPNQATLTFGEIDIRPNAYMGAWFRVYATSSAPTGYTSTTNNVDEQMVDDFDPVTQKVYLESPLQWPALAGKGGTWSYEIVPFQNWTIFRPIVFRAAREIANSWGRRSRANGLNQEYQACMRNVLMLFSHVDGAYGGQFDRRSYRNVNRVGWIF